MNPKLNIVPTADGSQTLRHEGLGQLYHSDRGAMGESMHVFILNGLRSHPAWERVSPEYSATGGNRSSAADSRSAKAEGRPRSEHSDRPEAIAILEAGFGSGLNALLTLREAELTGRAVDYTAVELYPVDPRTAARMDYASDPRFMALHNAGWDGWQQITPLFRLRKIRADLVECEFDTTFDIVYFDAFAPDVQPGLWSAELFARIASRMNAGGILVTYSSKGAVKRGLAEAGLKVERLPGALGKRHMVRAVKI